MTSGKQYHELLTQLQRAIKRGKKPSKIDRIKENIQEIEYKMQLKMQKQRKE